MPVIKLAQQGFDVSSAGDENLIYSSEWPLLKEYKSGPFTIGDVTQQQTIATHDLGFPAMYWYFTNNNINSWLNTGVQTNDNRSEFFGSAAGGSIGINSGQLSFTPGTGVTGSLSGYYYIFAINLAKQFTAPINQVGGSPVGGNRNRVFKVAKPGKSALSNNLDDFAIHSDCRSPLIHSVNPGTVSGGSYTVFHDLSYVPMFFGYSLNSSGQYILLPTGSGGSTVFNADTDKVTFKEGVDGRQLSVVVLKDPFLVNYSTNVTV